MAGKGDITDIDEMGTREKRDITDNDATDITTYSWDNRNRLTEVSHQADLSSSPDQVIDYTYDMFDRLTSRTVNGDTAHTEYYVYDGQNLVLVLDPNANVIQRFLNGPDVDQVLAQVDGATGNVSWLLTDNQGSVRDVAVYTAASGTTPAHTDVVDHVIYGLFGNIASQTATDPSEQPRFTYAGRPYDSASGLYNDRGRWYDAGTGSFLSEDPSGLGAGDVNLSRYAGNNPVNFRDPTGNAAVGGYVPLGSGARPGVPVPPGSSTTTAEPISEGSSGSAGGPAGGAGLANGNNGHGVGATMSPSGRPLTQPGGQGTGVGGAPGLNGSGNTWDADDLAIVVFFADSEDTDGGSYPDDVPGAGVAAAGGGPFSDYWYYLTNPSKMDKDLMYGEYVAYGMVVVGAGGAIGVGAAGFGGTVIIGGGTGTTAATVGTGVAIIGGSPEGQQVLGEGEEVAGELGSALSPLENEAVELAKDILAQREILARNGDAYQRALGGGLADLGDLDNVLSLAGGLYNNVLAQYVNNRGVLDNLLDAIIPPAGELP